jgi:hypothetical protein
MTKNRDIDWNGVEIAYRAGVKSLKAIGEEFGLSNAGVLKRAQREGWTRDLKERIRAATEAKVNAALVNAPLTAIREEQIIESASDRQRDTLQEQGGRIGKLSALSDRLTEELMHETENLELYEKLGELMHEPDDKGKDKLNEIYRKVINSGSRINSFRSLVESQKTLIGLQRQNVGLADNANGEANSEQKTEISDTEAARRIAFVFASAMHKKGE